MVPQFYTLLKKFIAEFYEFTDQLSENEDFIIRSTDTLIRKINEVLYNFLTMSSAVPQVIQIVVNLDHLLVACQFFKEYLNSLVLGDSKSNDQSLSSSNKVSLSSSNQLYTTKGLGEKLIIKLCERKIEDLMSSSANINWSPIASDDRPRDYIEDVITFLEFNLPFVQPLSHQLREEFITKAFRKISETLSIMIHSDQLKKFNLCGVKCFNADLKRIEDFAKIKADEKDRTTTTSRNLVGYFFELRQTVNLLLSENPEDFADSKIRSYNYNLLTNIPDLIILFQKYKEESKGFSQPKEQKDRNNKIANAIRKFREMV
ncbi:exocyst complex subunit [Heterostelium album PN500]|uniref:Exocyst complex subunit n=1 Tax=Heterostelium pallidum (strain ATCC 26659 / Pp 5 / PN500) TaxID=670386 RepID=D3B4S6_HETP5|nr:exocyst complex subunit [Heterostelium album PN500]EFA84324.1 exocyst complex subunit [Heterostelium album PN500]|eukprot:XP_020436439.1 exocyst complex subunit [Heterostelium album PN500]